MSAPTVFISSTYRDNDQRRKVVESAILTARMAPFGMEHFTASSRPTKQKCLELAVAADVVVAIVAWRYGWIPDGEERSITELECASANCVLWFVIDDASPSTPDEWDSQDEIPVKWPKLAAFKQRIAASGSMPARFKSDVELATKVTQALNDWKRESDHPHARIAPTKPPSRVAARDPYPGLVTFEEADEPFYFGREAEVGDALRRIASRAVGQNAWLSIEGASGAGKSSLVRAGLIPRARRDGESGPWAVALMRPGRAPFAELARSLAALVPAGGERERELERQLRDQEGALSAIAWRACSTGGRLLLVIDQLEELFTHSLRDPDGAEPELELFTRRLAEALEDLACPWQLVTTIRRDLLGELERAPRLDDLKDKAQTLNLPPMREAALFETIAKPARKAGLRFDPEHLPELIASDAKEVHNALPLLAYCLRELWHDCDGVLRASRYRELGGVAKALLGAADALLDRLRTRRVEDIAGIASWEDAALRLLRALVAEAGTGFARRRLARDEAIVQAGGGTLGQDVYLALSGGRPASWEGEWPAAPRLVIDSGDHDPRRSAGELQVELAHESLLTDWKRFRQHVERERDTIEWRDRLEKAARAWRERDEPAESGASGWTAERYEEVAGACSDPVVPAFIAALRREREGRAADEEIGAIFGLREEPYALAYADRLARYLADAYRHVDVGGAPLAAIDRIGAACATDLERVSRRHAELFQAAEPSFWAVERAAAVTTKLEEARVWLEPVLERARRHTVRVCAEIESRRSELVEGWAAVRDSIREGRAHPHYGEHGILPRYDLLPLRLRQSDDSNGRVWEFLVLGTGERPELDAKPGAWSVVRSTGMVVVLVPGGSFEMGSEEEGDARPHRVGLVPFFMAAHAYSGSTADERNALEGELDRVLPATSLDWFQALAAALALGGSLPTEAQWECACRAGTTTRFWSGDDKSDLDRVGWYRANSSYRVQPSGLKPASPWGLYDVHGNVWEWCRDWFEAYGDEAVTDPRGPRSGSSRVVRGGSFRGDADRCRSAFRSGRRPTFRDVIRGFRVAFPAAPELGAGGVDR